MRKADDFSNDPVRQPFDDVAALREENARLRDENDDLRASAAWWLHLYEEALHREKRNESQPTITMLIPVPIQPSETRSAQVDDPSPRAPAAEPILTRR